MSLEIGCTSHPIVHPADGWRRPQCAATHYRVMPFTTGSDVALALTAVFTGAGCTPGSLVHNVLRVAALIGVMVSYLGLDSGESIWAIVLVGVLTEAFSAYHHDTLRACIMIIGIASVGRSLGYHVLDSSEMVLRSVLMGVLAVVPHIGGRKSGLPPPASSFDALACMLIAWPGEPIYMYSNSWWTPGSPMVRAMRVLGLLCVALYQRNTTPVPFQVYECVYIVGTWPPCALLIGTIVMWLRSTARTSSPIIESESSVTDPIL